MTQLPPIKKPERLAGRRGETNAQTLRRWRKRWDEYRDAVVMRQCSEVEGRRARRFVQAFTGIEMKWLMEEEL